MVLEYPTKYLACLKCRGPLHLIEKNLNVLEKDSDTKTICVFVYECIRCKTRRYKVFDQIPDEIERATWALDEGHLMETGEVQPFT